MSKIDIALKELLSVNEIFSDIFNGSLFDGKLVVIPESLVSADTSQTDLGDDSRCGNEAEAGFGVRDIIRKTNTNFGLSILAVEGQSGICYNMPQRVLLYDSREYRRQVKQVISDNEMIGKRISKTAYIAKGQYILPVKTIVFYTGRRQWDAPLSLYDMFGFNQEQREQAMQAGVQDYKILVIDCSNISDEEIGKYHSDLATIFKILRAERRKERITDKNLYVTHSATLRLLSAITGAKQFDEYIEEIEDGKEMVDVCFVLDNEREEGIKIGLQKFVEFLVEEGKDIDFIMEKTELSEEEVKSIIKKI